MSSQKFALVTGSSRGIGKEIAIELARRGLFIYVHYRQNRAQALKTVEEVNMLGGEASLLQADLSNTQDILSMVDFLEKETPHLDVLINNAGGNRQKSLFETSEEDWDFILSLNLKSVFMLTNRLFQHLAKSPCSRVVNISSVSAMVHGPKSVPYAVSKAGVNSLTRLFARYGAEFNMLVNAVAPGLVPTELTQDEIAGESGLRYIESSLLKNYTSATDVALLTAFLASEENQNITGQVINISGGVTFG